MIADEKRLQSRQEILERKEVI